MKVFSEELTMTRRVSARRHLAHRGGGYKQEGL
jgi:hypothetical protein